MVLTGKLETEVEIKSPADKFYNIFRRNAHHIPNICSDKVHQIVVHEGDWETPGSVKNWGYTLGGTTLSLKETVESMDDENKSITFKVVEGEILNHFKTFKSQLKVKAKDDDGGSLVKWALEYEKAIRPSLILTLTWILQLVSLKILKPPSPGITKDAMHVMIVGTWECLYKWETFTKKDADF